MVYSRCRPADSGWRYIKAAAYRQCGDARAQAFGTETGCSRAVFAAFASPRTAQTPRPRISVGPELTSAGLPLEYSVSPVCVAAWKPYGNLLLLCCPTFFDIE